MKKHGDLPVIVESSNLQVHAPGCYCLSNTAQFLEIVVGCWSHPKEAETDEHLLMIGLMLGQCN